MPTVCLYCYKRQSAKGEAIRFHKFPLYDKELVQKWKDFCNLSETDVITLSHGICTEHFSPDSFFNYEKAIITGKKLRIKRGAIPTVKKKGKTFETIAKFVPIEVETIEISTEEPAEHLVTTEIHEQTESDENLSLKKPKASGIQKKKKTKPVFPKQIKKSQISIQSETIKALVMENATEDFPNLVQCEVIEESIDSDDISEVGVHVQNSKIFRDIPIQTDLLCPIVPKKSENVSEPIRSSNQLVQPKYVDDIRLEHFSEPIRSSNQLVQPKYVSDIRLEHFSSPKSAKISFNLMSEEITKLKKKLRATQREKNRLEVKVQSLTELVQYFQGKRTTKQ